MRIDLSKPLKTIPSSLSLSHFHRLPFSYDILPYLNHLIPYKYLPIENVEHNLRVLHQVVSLKVSDFFVPSLKQHLLCNSQYVG